MKRPHEVDGSELRNRRLALGLSQKQLAWLLGVSPETVSAWERRATAIQHPTVLHLAMAMVEQVSRKQANAKNSVSQSSI